MNPVCGCSLSELKHVNTCLSRLQLKCSGLVCYRHHFCGVIVKLDCAAAASASDLSLARNLAIHFVANLGLKKERSLPCCYFTS